MLLFLTALIVSFVSTLFIVRSSRMHGRFSHDNSSGPQKIHAGPVPRIGGMGIVLGVLAGLAVVLRVDRADAALPMMLLLCATPTLLAGTVEDITKNVSPGRRMFFTAISAGLAALLLDVVIPRIGWVVLDPIFTVWPVAALLTVFAVVGVTNSVNIIDGFNGLASMCVVIMLLAVAYVAFAVGDRAILQACLVVAGAVLGFFVWNYPGGLIFLGDGGAYFLGFMVSELALLLITRHPNVSPLFPLLVCVYPVFETVFSIYRRRFIRKTAPGYPDGVHLHHLIFKRVMRWTVGREDARAITRRNSMTSPYLWTLCLTSVAPAVLFWDNTAVIAGCIVVFAVVYSVLYWRIVRFRAPRWLSARR